jgi:DNA-directed RNA polymerase specialized sigma24 family protein
MVDPVFSSNQYIVQYYDELVKYLRAKVGSHQIVRDAVQETYLRVFHVPNSFSI